MRVALARALFAAPTLLLLDEPTVDPLLSTPPSSSKVFQSSRSFLCAASSTCTRGSGEWALADVSLLSVQLNSTRSAS